MTAPAANPIARRQTGSRSGRIWWVLSAITFLSVLDLAFTLALMHTTGMYESNPVAVAIVRYGPWALAGYKMACILTNAFFLWITRSTRLGRIGGWVSLAVLAVLTLYWAHCLTVVLAGDPAWDQGPAVGSARWVCFSPMSR